MRSQVLTIDTLIARNNAMFGAAPANENHTGWGEMFGKQCEVEKALRPQDDIDAQIAAQDAAHYRLIRELIEHGRVTNA